MIIVLTAGVAGADGEQPFLGLQRPQLPDGRGLGQLPNLPLERRDVLDQGREVNRRGLVRHWRGGVRGWRVAGLWGLDRYLLPWLGTPWGRTAPPAPAAPEEATPPVGMRPA